MLEYSVFVYCDFMECRVVVNTTKEMEQVAGFRSRCYKCYNKCSLHVILFFFFGTNEIYVHRLNSSFSSLNHDATSFRVPLPQFEGTFSLEPLLHRVH